MTTSESTRSPADQGFMTSSNAEGINEPRQSDAKVVPVTVDLRLTRLAFMAGTFAAVVILLMAPFHGRGVTVHSFLSADYTSDEQRDLRDNYNSYSSNIVSAFVTPSDWMLGTMLPVVYLAFSSRHHVQTNRAFISVVLFMGSSLLIKYLINNGFNAVNVQIVLEQVQAYVAPSDLKANTEALEVMADLTTNVSNPVSELGFNYLTNTVLRNAVAPIVLKHPNVCSAIHASDTSQFATGLVQSFGFPMLPWQSTVLPSNEFVSEWWSKIYLSDGNEAELSNTSLPMDANVAVTVFIHGLHVSRYFFRWHSKEIAPFNITGLIQDSMTPLDNSTGATMRTIPAAELLNLLPSGLDDEDAKDKHFLGAATELYRHSLRDAVNISQNEATMEFRHVDLWDNISFDAVTFEIPLRKNFYYRKLILSEDGTSLVEDTAATANYTSVDNIESTMDDTVYYDLDISADCGPNLGVCVMPRIQEFDYFGNEYHPEPQIKATAVCLNADGTEDFQIDYDYYIQDGNGSESSYLEAYWACNNKSTTSFWIISLGSRVVGDDMYDSPAPDAQVTSLDGKRSTLVNPRKIYSLTVGRLMWDVLHIDQEFNATCSEGTSECRGSRYLMDVAADHSFTNASLTFDEYILVGEDNIHMDRLSPYTYNDTDAGDSYGGFGEGTRWVSLMTLTRPSEDDAYTVRGSVILPYNFNSTLEANASRRGSECSLSAEDHLNHVVNNHFYIDDGLQATYTAGMYFLFQNGVVRTIKNVTDDGSSWTLAFDGNVQYVDLTVSIPTKSLVMTFCGVALILLCAMFVAIFSRCGRRSLLKNPGEMTPDMVADMMLNDSKYPLMLLVRRFEHDDVEGGSNTFQQFRIDGLMLHHEAMGTSMSLPLNANANVEPGRLVVGARVDTLQPYHEALTPRSTGEWSTHEETGHSEPYRIL